MSKTAEFYFDVGSPASYLAWTQLPTICEETGGTLVYKPILLGGVFQAIGNASPAAIPAKGAYTNIDYARHARLYGVPYQCNPHFPIITLTLMRAVTGVQMRMPDRFQDFLRSVFHALWVDALNLNQPQLVAKTLVDAGFDVEAIMALTNDAEVKSQLRSTTEEAVKRGVFGAPTTFVGEHMFFGQDRLEWVCHALQGKPL
ncbi:2-hydroxychromene-2-carboxylate isomerase [Cupriavidus yeoncheonensis]|uniref:2-hydroxychromene-2-carboxylate isomerase n=1 Tax=Cupriavidus yeoncheonensis TaxID=1462994 RepID=A0A916J129_9BURK|nr:2-hydroxychromene-2-carboxylate isomerase [Cupriavidus yeoncheonensis]CAG2156615.1 2-hydroxychromene-2-carboxylate isomerase [Cupriavidus yeoncheonensis]